MKRLETGSPTPKSGHNYASKLESKQFSHKAVTSKTITTASGQGERNSINHAHKVDRTSVHGNMGASKAGHKYPGRRA